MEDYLVAKTLEGLVWVTVILALVSLVLGIVIAGLVIVYTHLNVRANFTMLQLLLATSLFFVFGLGLQYLDLIILDLRSSNEANNWLEYKKEMNTIGHLFWVIAHLFGAHLAVDYYLRCHQKRFLRVLERWYSFEVGFCYMLGLSFFGLCHLVEEFEEIKVTLAPLLLCFLVVFGINVATIMKRRDSFGQGWYEGWRD